MKHITLWIPAAEQPRWACVLSWWNLEAPENTRIDLYRSGANNPVYTWNKAVKDFLDTDNEWLLSIHNDVVVAPQTLTRLLSWDKPLVSALIFMRTGPVTPHVWNRYPDSLGRMVQRLNDTRVWFYKHSDWIRQGAFVMEPRPEDALTPVDFTSTSCTLIHRSVLEDMRALVNDVWFECDDPLNGGGEDRRFFQNALEIGYQGYVDRSCVVGHLSGDIPTSSFDFVAWDSVFTFKGTGEEEVHSTEKHAIEAHP